MLLRVATARDSRRQVLKDLKLDKSGSSVCV